MSDEQNLQQAQTTAADPGKKPGFMSTTGGKIVAVIVGLGVLGMIAGIAVAIVLYVFGSQAVDQLQSQTGQITSEATATPAAVATAAPAPAAPAARIANSEVFTFRDIFVPLLGATATQAGTSAGGTGATDTVTPTTSGVLYLTNVTTEAGVMKGVFSYNNNTYTLGPGESVPGTPWQVVRVSSASVTMLYGDVQVTLAIGQGRAK